MIAVWMHLIWMLLVRQLLINELDFGTLLGTQSGPDDFEIEIVDNMR
jgi:hypothetical protein